jgi:hypothetical protein
LISTGQRDKAAKEKMTTVRPTTARFDDKLGEFALACDDVRRAANPEEMILDFLRSTYEVGATSANWNRIVLEQSGPDVGRNLGAKAGSATDDPVVGGVPFVT